MCIDAAMNNNMHLTSTVSMGLMLYSVIFTGQASLGTKIHLIHDSNDALAASTAGPDARAREQFDRQSATHAYTRQDVATRTHHVFFNKKNLQCNAQYGSEGECLG